MHIKGASGSDPACNNCGISRWVPAVVSEMLDSTHSFACKYIRIWRFLHRETSQDSEAFLVQGLLWTVCTELGCVQGLLFFISISYMHQLTLHHFCAQTNITSLSNFVEVGIELKVERHMLTKTITFTWTVRGTIFSQLIIALTIKTKVSDSTGVWKSQKIPCSIHNTPDFCRLCPDSLCSVLAPPVEDVQLFPQTLDIALLILSLTWAGGRAATAPPAHFLSSPVAFLLPYPETKLIHLRRCRRGWMT